MTAHYEESSERAERTWTRKAPPMRDTSPAPEHDRGSVPADYRKVKGWGVDLDPANRPAYPKELPSDVMTARGEVKDWQVPKHKIHLSIEHPNLTPVFGTSCPPKGLSGLLRDYAFRYSEGTNRHWMTLIFADRIDILESLITDALRGKPDNIIKEKGWGVRMQAVDPARRVRYMAYGAMAVGAIALGAYLASALTDSE